MTSNVVALELAGWHERVSPEISATAVAALERGDVLLLPRTAFIAEADDSSLFSPAILSSSKNASFDPSSGTVGGTTLDGGDLDRLKRLMMRFSENAASLVNTLFPRYRRGVERARTSFRPAEIAGRETTWRKDDTRLHVDSFPSSPVQGRRILRVFSNMNPEGRGRSWRIGEGFEDVAARFTGSLTMPWPGSAAIRRAIRLTKTRRSAYDALMLQLHDRMKADDEFQERSAQTAVTFAAGTTWIAFTDQVSHAAMAGQYQLEQTFYVDVDAMLDPSRSPLRILERLKNRKLV